MLSVTASEAKQSPGLRGDCFVAKNAPRNDNYTKIWHCQTIWAGYILPISAGWKPCRSTKKPSGLSSQSALAGFH